MASHSFQWKVLIKICKSFTCPGQESFYGWAGWLPVGFYSYSYFGVFVILRKTFVFLQPFLCIDFELESLFGQCATCDLQYHLWPLRQNHLTAQHYCWRLVLCCAHCRNRKWLQPARQGSHEQHVKTFTNVSKTVFLCASSLFVFFCSTRKFLQAVAVCLVSPSFSWLAALLHKN